MINRMQTAGTGPHKGPTMVPAPRQTHGLTVLGWVVVCFSSLPIAMGLSGEGPAYEWFGLLMLAAGAAMVMVGKRLRRDEPR